MTKLEAGGPGGFQGEPGADREEALIQRPRRWRLGGAWGTSGVLVWTVKDCKIRGGEKLGIQNPTLRN